MAEIKMRHIRTLCLITFTLAALPVGAETLQERVAAAQRRWVEYQELMESADPIARSEGFNAALADENLGIRNDALWTYLYRRDRLPIEITTEPGGRLGPGDVPNIALTEVKWVAEQRALDATVRSFGDYAYVTGQVIAGRLQVRYLQLHMPDFVGQNGGNPSSGKLTLVSRACSATLMPSQDRSALEGRLSCEGLPQTLTVRMPLG